jgi:integrase
MIVIAYHHGLRASEVCDLQWHQVELAPDRFKDFWRD